MGGGEYLKIFGGRGCELSDLLCWGGTTRTGVEDQPEGLDRFTVFARNANTARQGRTKVKLKSGPGRTGGANDPRGRKNRRAVN